MLALVMPLTVVDGRERQRAERATEILDLEMFRLNVSGHARVVDGGVAAQGAHQATARNLLAEAPKLWKKRERANSLEETSQTRDKFQS